MGNSGWEGVKLSAEFISESKVSERRRELAYILVEQLPTSKMKKRRWKAVNRLIEVYPKSKVSK